MAADMPARRLHIVMCLLAYICVEFLKTCSRRQDSICARRKWKL